MMDNTQLIQNFYNSFAAGDAEGMVSYTSVSLFKVFNFDNYIPRLSKFENIN